MEYPAKIEADEGEGQQRVTVRDSLFLAAALRKQGEQGEETVRVRNLSAGGMMADCKMALASGDRISLTLRGVGDVEGVVAWSTNGRFGVQFDTPIDPKLARKPVGRGGEDPMPYVRAGSGRRPGVRSE